MRRSPPSVVVFAKVPPVFQSELEVQEYVETSDRDVLKRRAKNRNVRMETRINQFFANL